MDAEIWILHIFCVTNHILLLILFQPFTKVKNILGSGPSWNRNQAGHVPWAVVAKPCSGILCGTQVLTCLQGGHWERRPAHRPQFSSVTQLCPTLCNPWTAAHQASLSITKSRSLLKLMSMESVMPSYHLILCRPLLLPPSIFPSIRVFSNESVLHIRRPNIGVSASASVLPMNIQDWFPLGRTGWISLQSKGLSRVFSNTTVQEHQFFGAQLFL